eukprot:PhM_4_TR5214/c0_g2_i1/m.103727
MTDPTPTPSTPSDGTLTAAAAVPTNRSFRLMSGTDVEAEYAVSHSTSDDASEEGNGGADVAVDGHIQFHASGGPVVFTSVEDGRRVSLADSFVASVSLRASTTGPRIEVATTDGVYHFFTRGSFLEEIFARWQRRMAKKMRRSSSSNQALGVPAPLSPESTPNGSISLLSTGSGHIEGTLDIENSNSNHIRLDVVPAQVNNKRLGYSRSGSNLSHQANGAVTPVKPKQQQQQQQGQVSDGYVRSDDDDDDGEDDENNNDEYEDDDVSGGRRDSQEPVPSSPAPFPLVVDNNHSRNNKSVNRYICAGALALFMAALFVLFMSGGKCVDVFNAENVELEEDDIMSLTDDPYEAMEMIVLRTRESVVEIESNARWSHRLLVLFLCVWCPLLGLHAVRLTKRRARRVRATMTTNNNGSGDILVLG